MGRDLWRDFPWQGYWIFCRCGASLWNSLRLWLRLGWDGSKQIMLEVFLVGMYRLTDVQDNELVDEEKNPGAYIEQWDGRNNAGGPVASGVYFYKLATKYFSSTKKLIVVR